MSREIWLGPVLGNNRERLIARCADHIRNGQAHRLLFIAASHPLLDLVTEKLLDGKNARGVWGELPVYLFRGFVNRIHTEAVAEPGAVATGSAKDVAEFSTSWIDPVAIARGSDILRLAPRVPIDHEELPLRHSLVSQIIKQLSAAGRLTAIEPLANRDGCVNTIASIIGELQRAGTTPDEFRTAIEERALESKVQGRKSKVQGLKSQAAFDRDVAVLYATYAKTLDRFDLTDEDADQLRALQIIRGELNGRTISIPWLKEVDLLVLDGFFDFTPVQGEILRVLIPSIPNVIVNLNYDQKNPDIFRPFRSTIDQLEAIAPFEIRTSVASTPRVGALSTLSERLFNVGAPSPYLTSRSTEQHESQIVQVLECSDRELEIRSIAKEIKRLIFNNGLKLSEIALVVRERASYADTIVRVFADESIPCYLTRRVAANDIPAVRACGKVLQLLKAPREQLTNLKANEIGDLIKTGYFRPSREDLEELAKVFDREYASLLNDGRVGDEPDKLRVKLGISKWCPDDLENAIAYVGNELRVGAWIDRARKLIRVFPSPDDARSLLIGAEADDAAATAADEAPPEDGASLDRRRKPAPIHSAALAWAILLLEHFQRLMSTPPTKGTPDELCSAVMVLLDRLQFSKQVDRSFNGQPDIDLPQATLDVRGREALRRAMAAAARSFRYAQHAIRTTTPTDKDAKLDESFNISLSSFVEEVDRSLQSQVLTIGGANRDGLRVLEATDIRGLQFPAIFLAGMIEGGFPLRASRDWLYPHEERVRLQEHGIFLEDISTDTLLKEEHYFYQTACRATERLYLTRPLALNDGTETVASYYIEELKRAIQPEQIEVKQIRADVDSRDINDASTPRELATMLIRQGQSRHQHAKRLPPPTVIHLLSQAEENGYASASALGRVSIEGERNGQWFGPRDGEITNPNLLKMLARHFGPEHVYSASRLSTYGNCAFRFFANRLLRIEPRTEAALDLQAIDAGKLLHDILRRFFEKHRGEYLPTLDRESLRQELSKTAEQVFAEHEDKVPPLNERIWKIDCEIRKLILDQVLLYELRLQEKTSARALRPTYFELAFGRVSPDSDPASTTDFLRIERQDNGEAALLQGQIDRVDVSEDRRTAIAYDYKLSRGAKLNDIKAGRELQLQIYLAALEQLFLSACELAGGGYYILRGGANRLNRGLYRLSHADCTNVTYAKGMLDDPEWHRIRNDLSARIWKFIDGMRGGDFRVQPSQGRLTCKYCDYSAVCRYDAYRRKKTIASLNH